MGKSVLNYSLAVILALAVPAIAAQPGAISPQASCAATGTIVVSYETDAFKAQFFGNSPYVGLDEGKSLVLNTEDLVPGKSRICLQVWVLNSAEGKITSVDPAGNQKPIKVKFKDEGVLKKFFDFTDWTDVSSTTPPAAPAAAFAKERNTGNGRRANLTYSPPATEEWAEIEYPKGSGVWWMGKRINFTAEIKLGGGDWLGIDPDVVIIKPGG